jgi:flagellar hook-associated protein 1 FlgK
MSLEGALSVASSSLANINYQLGVVSNNVANANTPDYTDETANQENLLAGSVSMGVQTEATTRAINLALQQSVFQQDTTVSGLTTTASSLQALDALQGTPGQGNDLGSLLGDVQNAFSTLLGDPSSASQQSAVVSAAGSLTNGINAISNAYTQQRQAAQTDIVSEVSAMNANLTQIGSLSDKIIAAKISGQSSADLENQRDAAVHALSGILSIRMLNQPNGDLIVTTASGTQLPTRANAGSVATSGAVIGASATYANGGIPPITLGGVDITSQIQGGQLGADISLRDNTLPTFQGELDEFSYQLASRFSGQGLTLFTDPTGNVPAGGGIPAQSTYVGFASTIQVNSLMSTTPSLVRDGTQGIGGSPTGASSFAPNPAGGPAGFTAMISRVLDFAMGAQVQSGVAQPGSTTMGLGPDGTLNAPYGSPATLADNATSLVSAQAGVSAAATSQLSTEQAVQTTLTSNLTAASGVNMDTEMTRMIQLQNAYGANARIITTVQSMFTQLLATVQ